MDTILCVENVSKKFCRSYKLGSHYLLKDIAREISGLGRKGSLRKGEFWALQNVDFKLGRGESFAIMGRNGSGKTTLLKIASGLVKPDTGTTTCTGRTLSLFAKGAAFNPVLSGRENIESSLSIFGVEKSKWLEISKQIQEFSELSDEVLAAPVKTYSSGMGARLGFACAAFADPDLIIIDEALAVGDMGFRMKCYKRLRELKAKGTSFILVSHSTNAILQMCDRAMVLDEGKVEFVGSAYEATQFYSHQILEKKQFEAPKGTPEKTQEKFITTLSESINGFIIQTEQSTEKILSLTSGQSLNIVVTITSNEAISNCSYNIILRNQEFPEQVFIFWTSHSIGQNFDIKIGENKRLFSLDPLVLPAGRYNLKTFVTSQDGLNVLCVIESTSVKVTNHLPNGGLFQRAYTPTSIEE